MRPFTREFLENTVPEEFEVTNSFFKLRNLLK